MSLKQDFKISLDGGYDELDFVLNLLERRITGEQIKNEVGYKEAMWFNNFCSNHGLNQKGV